MSARAMQRFCAIRTGAGARDLPEIVAQFLPRGDFRRILIKPNWVRHEERPEFPIAALTTSSHLIDAVIGACLDQFPRAEAISIGDVPLQNCDWDLLAKQAGIDTLAAKYANYASPRISFVDFRRERYRTVDGFFQKDQTGGHGDPRGYRDIVLDGESFLDSVSDASETFRVSDYDPRETSSSHSRGTHRYCIAASALDCDLFINLPKLKTHQKAGVTGALKNIVGINDKKAFLVHYQQKSARSAGDEFPPDTDAAIILQTRVRDLVQKRSRTLFRVLRAGWLGMRRLNGIQTVGTPENLGKKYYIAAGSWYGNDTVWRMVYDLNRIIRYAPPVSGERLAATPQREYLAIMDAMVAGEGDGPLQALPVPLDALLASNDPFLIDAAAARLMGFEPEKIPTLRYHNSFGDDWGKFEPDQVEIEYDDRCLTGLCGLPVLHDFLPPPGWRNHIECSGEHKNELAKEPVF